MAERKNTELSLLPEEIVLFQILPKVPGKSLLRFRCVCKQWQSFLTSPLFANIHLHHVTTTTNNNNNEKVVFHLKGSHSFQTVDCHEDGLTTTMPRRYPFERYGSLLATPVNGLVLVMVGAVVDGQWSKNMILWNPLTSEYKKIPSPPFDTTRYLTFVCALELYHTCSDDDYKILIITTDRNVYVYSLKSDSWKKLESTLDFLERIPYAAADANSLEGKLHFRTSLRGGRYMITRLDLKTEKFTKIALPPSCEPALEVMLAVVRGCIQLTVFIGGHG
ncbi:hypothetical protein OSB04_009900 [Centaurea solstitialis]|uniref:F-box domain-containing protein n=1 Tax=Centaurea solstitialis TaxID=347529 RepID=A0AA38TJN6_9ASTR|nr:hypothetical protein OSB04_009900 [Centaurea solstitialis]